ncbi:MAG TPA: hypothetical protein VEL74_14575 [Thermoanaerobaculia bacterium]|nr:hypothetical protein [Thermoanaerobaculia bacterium]
MMIRPFTRALSAAVVILALALLVASPVQAAPSKAPRLSAKLGSNFLDAALSWLNGFLNDLAPAASERTEMAKVKPAPTGGGSGTPGGATVQTGSCIDPQGNPCIFIPEP